MFDVRTLANQKHQNGEFTEQEWMRTLESARLSLKLVDIDFESLEQMALASRSPQHFTVMTRLIYQYGRSHPFDTPIAERLTEFVSESPFSLRDWIDAIYFFYTWLEQNHRKIDFLPMLKYLQCCVASPDARGAGQTLNSLLPDMLEVCGYESS